VLRYDDCEGANAAQQHSGFPKLSAVNLKYELWTSANVSMHGGGVSISD